MEKHVAKPKVTICSIPSTNSAKKCPCEKIGKVEYILSKRTKRTSPITEEQDRKINLIIRTVSRSAQSHLKSLQSQKEKIITKFSMPTRKLEGIHKQDRIGYKNSPRPIKGDLRGR